MTLAGSSPERFLRWTRAGRCQFRPIKGTVRKSAGVTRERAEALLASAKERAENLMITDLVRHDLHGVVGAGGVGVPRLMQVEEYATVFQLVSVIEGRRPPRPPGRRSAGSNGHRAGGTAADGRAAAARRAPRGIDVLAAIAAPGSMTGAPKRRPSCEILAPRARRGRAARPRGVYSGACWATSTSAAGRGLCGRHPHGGARWDPPVPSTFGAAAAEKARREASGRAGVVRGCRGRDYGAVGCGG